MEVLFLARALSGKVLRLFRFESATKSKPEHFNASANGEMLV